MKWNRIIVALAVGLVGLWISGCDFEVDKPQVECSQDSDCVQGYCDAAKGECVACTNDSHCPSGKYCDPDADQCVACYKDAHCEKGVCSAQTNQCVECFSNDDCASGMCDEVNHICVVCGSDDDCDDLDPCTAETCVEGTCEVAYAMDGQPCDDGEKCTLDDVCTAGVCVGGPKDPGCEEPPSPCEDAQDGMACDDGDECTLDDYCLGGKCVADSIAPECFEQDLDGDGFSVAEGDCNDTDGTINPAAPEVCNNIDDDCDGEIDEGVCQVECVVSGCSGQICASEPMDSDCQWLPEYECLQFSECGPYAAGQCGWLKTPEYVDCLNGLCVPKPEICNNIDDDCDGDVDEGCPGPCSSDADCVDNDQCTADMCVNGMCEHKMVPGCGTQEECGGLIGLACPDNQFCLYEEGTCGFADMLGICTDIPGACLGNWKPVCGCDGKTYSNDCVMMGAGMSKLHDGECGNPGDLDGDGFTAEDGDCNDLDATVHPGAPEACDDMDNDCDGEIDEGCPECVGEGGSVGIYPGAPQCCPGLKQIPCDGPGIWDDDGNGECMPCDGAAFCTQCGNGVCKFPENICNCPQDCEQQPPVCVADDGCDDGNLCTKDYCMNGMCVHELDPNCGGECNEMCDCYDMYGMGFPEPCPMMCPTCDNFWTCEQGKCMANCGPMPEEVQKCIDPCQPEEICNNNIDDNCDGVIDEGCQDCVKEGGGYMGADDLCCPGLVPVADCEEVSIPCDDPTDPNCGDYQCNCPKCLCFVCTKCGDGNCGEGENKCNCAQDCLQNNECVMASQCDDGDDCTQDACKDGICVHEANPDCVQNCVGEGGEFFGESSNDNQCCPGLTPVFDCLVEEFCYPDDAGNMICEIGCACPDCYCMVCTYCGDGVCGKGENMCNCEEDCLGEEICGNNIDDDGDGLVDEDCDPVALACGGFVGLPCPQGMYCKFEDDTCNWADQMGECTFIPQNCPFLWDPVCGCDGKTYANECAMEIGMVSKLHNGECGQAECVKTEPNGFGPCDAIIGVVFNGDQCVMASGCSCEPFCDQVFDSYEECEKACF